MVDDQVTVLVVEDDVDTALFVRTVLERRGGMAVVVAHEAMAALAEATRRPPDVVVTDIQLPGMSGLELLGELRRLAPGVPVVVMTAFASVDYAVDALHREADDFLVKPVSAGLLVERVTAAAERGRGLDQEVVGLAVQRVDRVVDAREGRHDDDG
ncbi:response regulator, partial [bacterium]